MFKTCLPRFHLPTHGVTPQRVQGEKSGDFMKIETIDRVPLGAPGLHLGIQLQDALPSFVVVRLESRWLTREEAITPEQADRLAVALQAAAVQARMRHGVQR